MRTWQVETQCPQCGAPITLKEAQHVLNCPYCKTRLYLTPKGPFRYAIPPKIASDETIFLPFWRIKGLGFTAYLPPKTVGKPIDKTYLAIDIPLRMMSLGMRPQATKLSFASVEEGPFVHPRVNFKDLLKRATRQIDSTLTEREVIHKETNLFMSGLGDSDPFDHSDLSRWSPSKTQTVFKKYEPVVSVFLDEGNSLIYFPVIPESGTSVILNDGLTTRPIGKMDLPSLERFTHNASESLPSPGTLPLLCPNCGWDLKCEEESWAVLCPGCDRVWGIRQGHYTPIPFEIPANEDPDAFYLPFWKIQTAVPQLELHDTRDLARFANQVRISSKSSPLHAFIPAFKVQPRLFLQICKVFTLAQPETHLADKIPKNSYPVLLPPQKVQKLIPIVLAEIGAKKDRFFPELPQVKPEIKQVSLAFLPFKQTGYEVVYQESVIFAIPRNALKWGRKL